MLLLVLGAAPASAQDGPRRLFMTPPVTEPQEAPKASPEPAIRVEPLTEPGLGEIGDVAPGDDLGRDPFAGSDAEALASLLRDFPRPSPLSAYLDLPARLLTAPLPPELAEADYLTLRIRILTEMGLIEPARRLLAGLPNSTAEPELADLARVLAFSGGTNARAQACAEADALAAADANILETRVACAVVGEDLEATRLALSLAHDTGAELDPAVAELAQAAVAGERADVRLPGLSPLAAAMLLEIVPAEANAPSLSRASGLVQLALARNPNAPANMRLAAAEAAAAGGALDADALRRLYLELEPERGDETAARAGLVRAIARADGASAKVQELATAWGASVPPALRLAWGEVLGGVAADLVPGFEGLAASEPAVTVLLLGRHDQQARAWLTLLQARGMEDRGAAETLARVRPLAVLAGLAVPSMGQNTDLAPGERLLFQALADALDVDVDGASPLRLALAQTKTAAAVPLNLSAALDAASDSGRPGEVALLAHLMLSRQEVSAPALVRTVAALRAAGLRQDAHRLALAALVLGGEQ
jgi:hypothetical protein